MSQSTPNGIIAVTNQVPNAGAVVWWRLAGNVDHQELCETWKASGLDEARLPNPPSHAAALVRAVEELKERHLLVRVLPSGGYAVVEELYEEGQPKYLVVLNVLPAGPNDYDDIVIMGSREEDLAPRVRTAYKRYRAALSPRDISHWLTDLVQELLAVSLRDKGGIYFIPAPSVEEWHRVVKVLQEVSTHFMAEIPAMRSAEAVAAILDAIEREAEAELDGVREEFATGELKRRALQTRVQRCVDLDGKVSAYENLLGKHLDTLRERVEAVRAQMTATILQLDIDAEDEAGAAHAGA